MLLVAELGTGTNGQPVGARDLDGTKLDFSERVPLLWNQQPLVGLWDAAANGFVSIVALGFRLISLKRI